MKTGCVIGFFLCGFLLVGCSSAQSDWSRANASNTVAGYQQFIDEHPNTTQAVVARNRIHAVQDQQAWARAQQANTAQASESYLQWAAASSANTVEALQGFLQKYPQGPQASQAQARLEQITGYRVQLASSKSETQAERIRQRLQGKYGDVLGSVDIVPGSTSNVRVVRSAAMGEGEANSACAKLKRDHLTCEVVRDVNS